MLALSEKNSEPRALETRKKNPTNQQKKKPLKKVKKKMFTIYSQQSLATQSIKTQTKEIELTFN